MLKTQPIIEIEKGSRKYVFVMPTDAPLGEAYDATFQVLKHITDLAQRTAESARPKEHTELVEN